MQKLIIDDKEDEFVDVLDTIFFDFDLINNLASLAAEYDREEILDRLMQLDADDFNLIAYGAAKGNNIHILKMMVEMGADDWYYFIQGGCNKVTNGP